MEDKNQKKHFKASFMGYIHSAVGYQRIFNNKKVASVQLRQCITNYPTGLAQNLILHRNIHIQHAVSQRSSRQSR